MIKKITLSTGFLVLFFIVFAVRGVSASSLQFDPTTITTQQNETFQVKIDVDSGTNEILAADARITYDKAILSVEKIDNGSFFPTIGKADFTTTLGEIYIAGIVDDPGDFKTGSGTIATVTFKAISENGTATLAYTCIPGETGRDSNIAKNDFDATDVIDCTENGTSRVTIGVGGPTSGVTPTVALTGPTNTPYPTPSHLPEGGVFSDMVSNTIVQISVIMVGLGLVIKLLLL